MRADSDNISIPLDNPMWITYALLRTSWIQPFHPDSPGAIVLSKSMRPPAINVRRLECINLIPIARSTHKLQMPAKPAHQDHSASIQDPETSSVPSRPCISCQLRLLSLCQLCSMNQAKSPKAGPYRWIYLATAF